jgi:hypothetical protein
LLFTGQDAHDARALLETECGRSLPFHDDAIPESLERIRYACLRLSGGDVAKLCGAVGEAQIDWRDVLVAAGFADDVHAHTSWWPERTA